MRKIITVYLILLSQSSFAQNPDLKRTWHWYFGQYVGIDFSSGVAIPDTANLYTNEGCSSISDTNGNLLFYTDGKNVWNKNHLVMPNGIGLARGHNGSSTQEALIVPQPLSPNLFYVFTTDEAEHRGANGFRYSIVDMNLNGGLGDVTIKNVTLFTPCTEKLAAVNHCNDTNVWIVGHKSGTNEFFSYLLTSSGLNTTPVITAIGSIIDTSQGGIEVLIGALKFSSDGSKAAVAIYNKKLELYDFNNQSGVFTNRIILDTTNYSSYGVEFSFSNKYLYYSETLGPGIYQYDISSNDSTLIANSKILIYMTSRGYGLFQKAADGKIYIGTSVTPPYKISVINAPDSAGLACNFRDTSFAFNCSNCAPILGLPNYNCSYFKSFMNLGCAIEEGMYNKYYFNSITVFPNTARDWVEIRGSDLNNIQLINVFGSVCLNERADNPSFLTINLSSFARGIYLLKINTKQQTVLKKIILN